MGVVERLTPRVELALGGARWRLIFTHAVLLDIEAETGLDILAGGFDPQRLSAKHLRAAVFVLARSAGAPHSLPEVGRLIGITGVPRVRAAIVEAWAAAWPAPEAADKPGKSPSRPLEWLDAWAIGDQDLGLSQEEWIAMTPRMAHALSAQRLETMRQWELMAGQVIAHNANWGYRPPKRPLEAKAFMLHPWPEEPESIGDHVMQEMQRMKQQ